MYLLPTPSVISVKNYRNKLKGKWPYEGERKREEGVSGAKERKELARIGERNHRINAHGTSIICGQYGRSAGRRYCRWRRC